MITMTDITRHRKPVTSRADAVVGWDIGGVNLKAARLEVRADGESGLEVRSLPFEVQRNPAGLAGALHRLADTLRCEELPHAVTMTAELSQAFRTKREGVAAVLDAVEAAFPHSEIAVYTVGGRFLDASEARERPIEVAASNWAATARFVARHIPDCLLIDIGTTTTDIVPIVAGELAALGRTDPERLRSGELVYTGALRTPCEAVAASVPLGGKSSGLAAEGFALMGDAHLWLGRLAPEDYTVETPDHRPATREFAGERLSRVVCADRDLLSDEDITGIAQALARAQADTIAAAILRVRARHPALATAVIAGLGETIAADAARRVGLGVVRLADRLGPASRTAPAAAVAWLYASQPAGRAT
jgi:probable H4MPT-linked C1 transfer pathway protein